MSRIDPADVDHLAAEVTGPVLLPGDAGYASEIAPFNASVVHSPALVVGAASAQDVQAAIRFAGSHGLTVSVQATGHGATVPFDGGVMISTKRLTAFSIDPEAREATFEAGLPWAPIVAEAAKHGLAPLSGASPTVGAVGYTLAGGLPLMGRTFGFAADRIRSADLVTPDGVLRHVSAEEHPELFWGLHGGKGCLGVVVKLTVELLPVERVYGGGIYFAEEHIPAVFRAFPAWAAALPDEMSAQCVLLRFPEGGWSAGKIQGRTIAQLRICYVGGAEDGDRVLAPIRAVAPAVLDQVVEMSYAAAESIYADSAEPVPYYQRAMVSREPTREMVDALLDYAMSPAGETINCIAIGRMGGAQARITGFPIGGQGAEWDVSEYGVLGTDDDAAVRDAVEGLIEALEPWATGGTFVNIHGVPRDEADRARAWTPEIYARLVELVRKTDPNRMFANEFVTAGLGDHSAR